MKKNLISVLILALCFANLVLTALLIFTIIPETKKANNLIDQVCQAISLDLNSGTATSGSLNKKSDGYKTYGEDLSAKKNVILADITDIIGDYTMEQYNTDKSAVHDKILKTLQKKFGADYIVDVNIVSSLTQ